MHFILGTLQTEFENLVQETNSFELCTISSIEDLKSGFVISQIILNSLCRQDLFTVVQGFSKDRITTRWSVVLDFMKMHFKLNLDDFLPEEIHNDKGVLFIVCKLIVRVLKDPRKNTPIRVWSSTNSAVCRTVPNEEPSLEGLVDLEELKGIIHRWLQDLKLIPLGIYMHEFLYRVRSGISLYELLKTLDPGLKKIPNFVAKPKSIADCIKNINFVLRHLRKFTSVHRRFLYSSASIYEGDSEITYGLLADIKDFFVQFNTLSKKSPIPVKPKPITPTPTPKIESKPFIKIQTVEKNSIIEWLSSIGLLHKVVFSTNFKKNTLENGTLLCEVVSKIFQCQIRFTPKPKTLEECQENLSQSLQYLDTQGFNVSPDEIQVSEELIWTVLLQIMKSNHDSKGSSKALVFKDMESRILVWLKVAKLLSESVKSIFDVVSLVQSGELLVKILNKYFKPSEPVVYDKDSLALVSKCLKVMKQFSRLNQRFTERAYEICQGELVYIIGILEDLYNFATSQPEPGTPKDAVKQFTSYSQAQDITQWMAKCGISCGNLTEDCLFEFKSGVKICEIVEKICLCQVENVIASPKTAAEALSNIRKGLEVLYRNKSFPAKYQYYDDLLLRGDGSTIRSFLTDLIRFC